MDTLQALAQIAEIASSISTVGILIFVYLEMRNRVERLEKHILDEHEKLVDTLLREKK